MKRRVLLIGPDPLELQLLWVTLEQAGWELDAATTARDGLFLAERARYAAVVAERRLLDGDGLDLCRELHALPGSAELPVVVAGGDVLENLQAAAVQAECAAYLVKPLDLGALRELLAHLAGGHGKEGR